MSGKARLEEKTKENKLKGQLSTLTFEIESRSHEIEALEREIESTTLDITNRDEQISRINESLMEKLQVIRALDDEMNDLEQKLALPEERETKGQETSARQRSQMRVNAIAQGSGGAEEELSSELGKIAGTLARLGTLQQGPFGDGMGGTMGGMIGGGDDFDDEIGAASNFNEVHVIYKSDSCNFKLVQGHTFKQLLGEVVTYWSLDPRKHVLVNESNCVWPSNALVHALLGQYKAQHKKFPVVKLFNREAEKRAVFDWSTRGTKDVEVNVALLRQDDEDEKEIDLDDDLDGADGGALGGGAGGGGRRDGDDDGSGPASGAMALEAPKTGECSWVLCGLSFCSLGRRSIHPLSACVFFFLIASFLPPAPPPLS